MKRHFIIAALATAGLVFTPAVAQATEVCVTHPAITIDHEAVGTPTIVIDNPDYVAPTYTPGYTDHIPAAYTPGQGAPTITVDNPDYIPATADTTEIVHHPAVTGTEWKYTRNGGHGFTWLDNNDEHKVKINGHWYQRTSDTRSVVITPAWDESITVPGTPAQGEPTIVIDNPDYVAPTYVAAHDVWVAPVYTPAVGAKTVTVENPDYAAAWTEVLQPEQIICEGPLDPKDPVEETPTPATPETIIPPIKNVPAPAAKTIQVQPVAPQYIETAAAGE